MHIIANHAQMIPWFSVKQGLHNRNAQIDRIEKFRHFHFFPVSQYIMLHYILSGNTMCSDVLSSPICGT